MANNKVFIPTFISNQNFDPARVQPRLLYYNGTIEVPQYVIYAWASSNGSTFITKALTEIPYFDHYNVVSGSYPSTESDSLLFYNETSAYGTTPANTLFSEYWQTYIELLYNPRTRLINAEAVIPLADYFELELNDIVEWRGNYYHLRAVNDYSFTTGECKLQLLGPIIEDTLDPSSFGTCYEYSVTNVGESLAIVDFISCDGNATSEECNAGQSTNIGCARSGSVTLSGGSFGGDVTLSEGSVCGTYPIYD
jgi:hypothetical protein